MRLVPVAITVLVVGFLVAGVGIASASQADISVADSIDTPEETIELEGSTYEVSAIAVREPGDSLTADVSIPDGSSGELDLYASDETVADWENVEDGESATFETSQLEPGTYMLALQIDGSYEAVHPVIISGYDMELSHSTEASPSESVTVTADVVQTHTDRSLDGVDVVVHGGGETIDSTAEQLDDDTYEATVDFDEHAEGEYQVYAAARNGGDTAGYPTLLGATAGETITVSADDDDDSGDDDSGNGDSDDGDSGDDDSGDTGDSPPDESDDDSDSEQEHEDEQDADESDGDEQDEEPEADDEDDSETDDETADNGADDSDSTDDQESEDSDEDESVIDPNGDEEPPEPTDDDQSLSLIVPVLGLVIGAFAIARRSTA